MEEIRSYCISVTTAAILCACVRRFAGEKDTAGKVVKLICGLFLAFTVVRPVADIQITDFALFTADIQEQAEDAVAVGEEFAQDAMADIIKSETEAYILDKAQALGLDVEVSITLGDTSVPEAVTITGQLSPYAKAQLQNIFEQELGIPKEAQVWIGSKN